MTQDEQTQPEQPRKIAVVTGATGGMGREIAADLSKDHQVYALGRNQAGLKALSECPNITPVQADLVAELLADDAQPGAQLADVLGLDTVDVVVHAAAIAEKKSVDDATPADWRKHFDINVFAAAELTRQLLPALRKTEGDVIYINSGAGHGGHPNNVVYAATKHALYAVADCLRKDERDIRVTTVAPGPTDTAMLEGLMGDYNAEHMIAPAEVARAVRSCVEAGLTTQFTELRVRPRIELADR
ncbi:SDR family oxidoreductase [Corynebacterium pseudodiphtheriticum]|uniref:SDR family oxidoreductase n=1 Tax=Corynebacterium pseudodiphtheriticum TaxID=37637 RepID=UPI0025430EC6|nr:SDR family oxidoreductase [Corynebacterium pseudodiphtheriticum]MDK4241533.1 SDR family oxidoreductase [Corynebacterium pseudodiphtheriticum]